ncbi:hypothetical protein B6D60_05945 [candidate division KSB1 bacterium 4484_87]|nr:MAG: hypothetical protein B6D60_05945 [candidate division KSB1 bacterium 4484_87]
MDPLTEEQVKKLQPTTEELKKLNEKLLDSERLKSQFLSDIRNEINNPLTSILGLSQLLKQAEESNTGNAQKLGSMIYKEAFFLSVQLSTIFTAADLEAGELFAEMGKVQIVELLSQTLTDFQENSAEKGVTIRFENDIPPEKHHIITDADKLRLVLNCLIANAIQFSEPGSEAVVKTSLDENEYLHIAVEDSGLGIDVADQERIFDRFVQLDTGTEKKFHGLGLGLSVAKSLVELLGGTIAVTSVPNQGSTFEIILPQDIYQDQITDDVVDEEGLWIYEDAEISETD